MIKYVETSGSLTVIIDNKSYIISKQDNKYEKIWEYLLSNNEQALANELKEVIYYKDDNWVIGNKGVAVYGCCVPQKLTKMIYKKIKYNHDINGIVRFFNRLPQNISKDNDQIKILASFIVFTKPIIILNGDFVSSINAKTKELYPDTCHFDKDVKKRLVLCIPEDVQEVYVQKKTAIVVMDKFKDV